ncbi:MAG: tetratricopeptide repeat protein [Cyanothece sp. SIO1E1]|nr:tetratricopeptide repeat protein [Cyanothece sp. SIO1E1]
MNQSSLQTKERTGDKAPQSQLKGLIEQQKYRQALELIKKARRSEPEFEPKPSEASIWCLRGQQEFERANFKQAESSFRRSLELGLNGESHYWIAKCLLALDQQDAAFDLIHQAFENQQLPKEYAGCYLKLLLLKGDTEKVKALIDQQPKRFFAAQLHWARGVLALKVGKQEKALEHFRKVQKKVTPGDTPTLWLIWTYQAMEDWEIAATTFRLLPNAVMQAGATQSIGRRLAIFQVAKTGRKPWGLSGVGREERLAQEAATVLSMLRLIEQDNLHDAGHAFLHLDRRTGRFPALATLQRPLLMRAGQQALEEGQLDCAETFWQPIATEKPFDLQLTINLYHVLEANESDRENQRLLTRLLNWLEKEAKHNPQDWPKNRLHPTLAKIHCFLADSWLGLGKVHAALGALRQAERLQPESPEVLGRKGLSEAGDGNYQQAIALLTQALEGGCRLETVYDSLLDCWEELEDKQAYDEVRSRFGKYFGDLPVDRGTEMPAWMEALSTQKYAFFEALVLKEKQSDPALDACEIFMDATADDLSAGRLTLDQELAADEWDTLLQALSPQEQIPALQAIFLSIQLFAKRKKGIAALLTKYQVQLAFLAEEHPEARVAHLALLAVKGAKPDKIRTPLRAHLDKNTQPGVALAQVQFLARRFAQTTTLTPFIDEALGREPQNPQLLLAKATTYPVNSETYADLKGQGFELARRLQDAKALQAFRDEEALQRAREVDQIMPSVDSFENFGPADMMNFMEDLVRKMAAQQGIPPEEVERMLPELQRQMMSELPNFDTFDDELPDFGFPFGEMNSSSQTSKKRKRRFSDL